MKTMGFRVTEPVSYGSKELEVKVFQTEMPTQEAQFAMALIERWGMVMGMPDGEDSAGRTRLKLMTPSQLVDRAFQVASEAYIVARQRGLMVELPDLNQINAENDARIELKRREKAEA
jgi:hypothetical protein